MLLTIPCKVALEQSVTTQFEHFHVTLILRNTGKSSGSLNGISHLVEGIIIRVRELACTGVLET